MFVGQLTCNNKGDLLITVAVGPKRRPVTFPIDTGAQITALTGRGGTVWNFGPVQMRGRFKHLRENPDSAHDSSDIMATGRGRPRGHHGSCGTFPNEPFRHGCFKG